MFINTKLQLNSARTKTLKRLIKQVVINTFKNEDFEKLNCLNQISHKNGQFFTKSQNLRFKK